MQPWNLLHELVWLCVLITGARAAATTVALSSLPGCGNASSPLLVGSLFGCKVNGSIMPGDSITWTWTVAAGGAANFSMHAIVRALQSSVSLQITSSVSPPIQLGVTYSSSDLDYISGEQYLLIPASILQAGTYNLTLQTPSAQIGPSIFTLIIQTPPPTLLLGSGQHRVLQDITALCCVYKGTAYSITTPGSLCQSLSAWGGGITAASNWATDICQQSTQMCDSSGALVLLDLMGAGLNCTGPLPASLSTLQALQTLNLQGIMLSNQSFQQVMSTLAPLSNLTALMMSGTGLRGNISCGAIPQQMQTLSLFGNSLTGVIPSCIGALISLGELYLGGNLMTGSIPNLANLTSLSFLDLTSNNWNSSLPQLPTSLIYLNASYTPLSGNLPAIPTTLQTLDCSYSALNGTISATISLPPQLQWLDLRFNALQGSLPPFPTQLQFLSLSSNALSGPLPSLLPSGIQYASLDSNRLSGPVPVSWGMATSLRYLIMTSNQLNSSLPSTMFASTASLENLDLGLNKLTGQIPVSLASLTSLSRLMLYNNAFSGNLSAFASALVAPGSSSQNNILVLDVENNRLSGTLPSGLSRLRLFQLLPGDTYYMARALGLANNTFTGQMPDWVFTALPGFLVKCLFCQMYVSLQGNQLGCPDPLPVAGSTASALLLQFNFYCLDSDSGNLVPLIGGSGIQPPPSSPAASANSTLLLWEGAPHVGRGRISAGVTAAAQAGFFLAPPTAIPTGADNVALGMWRVAFYASIAAGATIVATIIVARTCHVLHRRRAGQGILGLWSRYMMPARVGSSDMAHQMHGVQ